MLYVPESPSKLLAFLPATESDFTWGPCVSIIFMSCLNAVYSEVVHWRPNPFKDTYGKARKSFVLELTRLYKAFTSSSAMESIAMKAAIVLPT